MPSSVAATNTTRIKPTKAMLKSRSTHFSSLHAFLLVSIDRYRKIPGKQAKQYASNEDNCQDKLITTFHSALSSGIVAYSSLSSFLYVQIRHALYTTHPKSSRIAHPTTVIRRFAAPK